MSFDEKLQKFADSLTTPNFESEARAAVKEISEVLNTSKYKFNRCRMVGGLGKKTSTALKPDADIAAFFNDKDVSKDDVANEVRAILTSKDNVTGIAPGGYRKNIIQFTLNGQVPIDLVVARNYVNKYEGRPDTASEQMHNAISIKQHGDHRKDVSDLGAETTESSLEFMKRKGSFVQSVARLGKYWSQAIFFKEYVYGKSLIFELLATQAAVMEETKNKSGSLHNAFKAFLEIVSNIKKQDIVFEDNFKRSDISKDILTQRPLLMDPTNPYNNLLDPKKEKLNQLFNVMSKCADHTLNVLSKGSKDIKEIFYPQRLLETQGEQKNLVKPKNYQFGVYQFTGKMNPPLKPTCIISKKEDKFHYYFNALLHSYAAFVYNLSKAEKKSNKEMTNDVKELIDKVNGNRGIWKSQTGTYGADASFDWNPWNPSYGTPFDWLQTGNSHHTRDVAFQIPMYDKYVFLISFDFDER